MRGIVDVSDGKLLPGRQVRESPLPFSTVEEPRSPQVSTLGCSLCRAGYRPSFLVRACAHLLRPQGKACRQLPQGAGCFSHQEALLGDLVSWKPRYPHPSQEAPLPGTCKPKCTCCILSTVRPGLKAQPLCFQSHPGPGKNPEASSQKQKGERVGSHGRNLHNVQYRSVEKWPLCNSTVYNRIHHYFTC